MEVDRTELERVLELLKESKELHDYGDLKAHGVARQARELLESLLKRGGADAKSTT